MEAVAATATRIASGWGQEFHHTALAAEIADFYGDLVDFPPAWSEQRRRQFVVDAADTTAGELTVILDDFIYREADRPPVTEYGSIMHGEDRHHAVTAMLAALTDEHLTWWLVAC
jgi:hypothetical protein